MKRKTIFITGAAQGIGRATALLFAQKGWYIGAMDIDKVGAEELIAVIGKENGIALFGDVRKEEEIQNALAKFTRATDGKLHLLLNNVGIFRVGDFDELDLAIQFQMLDINVRGLIQMTHAALPYLKKTPNSQIINMASAAAIFGNPEAPLYGASKAAVNSLTEAWSIAFEKYDVRVSDINPIYANTNLVKENIDKIRALEMNKVKLTAEVIAQRIWKAAQRNKLHWYVGVDTKVFAFLKRILPYSIVRSIAKGVIKFE
ncbi:MAG: SDR family oxidoreductase [Bacteroidota bacterium]